MKNTACFVAEIDLALADKFREDLIAQGFELTKPPHTLFSALKKGVSCTLYTSGKLTVQGKDKDDFISFYLEPEILGNVSYSYPTATTDLRPRIGIDEAGKGDFFGPLCIGGVYGDEKQIEQLIAAGVRDSKEMSDKAVLVLSRKIKLICPHSLVRLGPAKYNELYEKFHNLNRLLAWGHATAIGELVGKSGCKDVIIDQFGDEHLVERAVQQKGLTINLSQRHKAEADPVVAAASILARGAFLEGLEQLGNGVGMILPKGASSQVLTAGRELVKKRGVDILGSVAKLHFKTRDQILGS